MNILFICNEYPPYLHGGIGTVTKTLAEGMHVRGHKVIVAGYYDMDEPFLLRDEQGIIVYRLRKCRWFARDSRSRFYLYRAVKKIIKVHSIDILEVPDYFGLLALWPRFSIPIIVRLHGSVTYLAIEAQYKVSKKYYFYELQTLKKGTHLIAVSKSIAQKTKSIFKVASPIEIIYNSIDINNHFGENFGNRENKRVIFTGTLMKIKGVFSLFEAWPEVVKINPQAMLEIYGKDSLNENGVSVKSLLLQVLSPNLHKTVTFYGHVSRDRILKELRTASVAVFPSFTEAFALAPLEAMAEGCPTIYTKLASGPEVIDDGENGLLIDPKNPKEIAMAIIKILMDKNFAAKIGDAGRKTVENRFSNNVIFEQNEKMYYDLILKFNTSKTDKSFR